VSRDTRTWAGLITGLQWVAVCTLGAGVGFSLGHASADAVPIALRRIASDTVLFAVLGTAVASGQWLVLRGRIAGAAQWVVVSAVVWVVLGALARPLEESIGVAACPFVAGAVLGIAQAVILRHQVRWAGLWVVASTLSWGAGWHVVGALSRVVPLVVTEGVIAYTIGYAIYGTMLGVFSAPAIVWLLEQE
jgi:hypothetical protein